MNNGIEFSLMNRESFYVFFFLSKVYYSKKKIKNKNKTDKFA